MSLGELPIETYQAQLDDKCTFLQQHLAAYQPLSLAVFPSPVSHYRMRAEFRVWHDGVDLYHTMFDQQEQRWMRVDQFAAASRLINHCMPRLIEALRTMPVLRYKLFRVDYLSTLSGQLLVSLIYHRPLEQTWVKQARILCDRLSNEGSPFQLVGRSLKQKICLDDDYVEETLTINGRSLLYRQVEGSFTQPNAAVNTQMLTWASGVLSDREADLLELYCGSGNFSLPLASNFRRLLATEVVKEAVATARYNSTVNQIKNIHIMRLSVQELTQALRGTRSFRRLAEVDLATYRCRSVMVDPPRSGLDPVTLQLVQEYEQILYVSCNPVTLQANLAILSQTHLITQLALFDQFPYTPHIECGVLLRGR